MNCKTMLAAAMGAALMTVAAGDAGAATKIWTGGGGDDNLSTAANWADGTAPASGDALVFAGNVRTTPVNDYDPETTTFTSLVFSNTCATAETSAAFTLSGNRLVLNGTDGVFGRSVVAAANVTDTTKSIEDVIDCEITLKQWGRFGSANAARHNLRFTKSVTASYGMTIETAQQMKGKVTFEGAMKGFTYVQRPNGGGGEVWLKSSENAFTTDAPMHLLREGILRLDSVAAGGGSSLGVEMGQQTYNTPGYLVMNASEDTEISGTIKINGILGGQYNKNGSSSYIQNAVAGTTLTISGQIVPQKTPGDESGVKIEFGGAGNGVFSGTISDPCLFVNKGSAGTWTLASNGSITNAISVSAGTLCVNGDWSTAKGSVVKSGATLCGTGKLGDVTFEQGSKFAIASSGSTLHVTSLVLNGAVTLVAPSTALAAGSHEILAFDAQSGTGAFTLDASWPAGTTCAVGTTSVVVTVPSAVLTWTGATDANWDFSTKNWANDATFSNGDAVSFDDTATRTAVEVAGAMQPSGVSVGGSKDWTFSGEGIGGTATISKSGTGSLTLEGTHSYAGLTKIDGGSLVVKGTLSGTSITVGSGAALTNAATSHLTGSGSIYCEGPAELDGNNEMTGGLTVHGTAVVKDVRALGAGDVTFKDTVKVTGSGERGAGKTLTINIPSGSSSKSFSIPKDVSFSWLGDVTFPEVTPTVNGGGTLTIGSPDAATTLTCASWWGLLFRLTQGKIHVYSRIESPKGPWTVNDGGTICLYASGNVWLNFSLPNGTVECQATNALSQTGAFSMCQAYSYGGVTYAFHPVLDLNGYAQTISSLVMNESDDVSSQTITSETPATLTIKNDANTTTERMQCAVTNAVTLRKEGTGAWTFAAKNASTGNVEVVEGTFIPASADSLPTGRNSTLFVTAGAKVAITNAINVTVPYLVYNGKHLPRGVYCGTGGASGTVNADIFAAGPGTLTVSRGQGGMLLIVR